MGSPYPSKEAVPQAIVPPLALSARRRKLRRRKHDKGGKRVGGRHISEEKIKGGGGEPRVGLGGGQSRCSPPGAAARACEGCERKRPSACRSAGLARHCAVLLSGELTSQ